MKQGQELPEVTSRRSVRAASRNRLFLFSWVPERSTKLLGAEMSRILIIAEKPSVATDLSRVLGKLPEIGKLTIDPVDGLVGLGQQSCQQLLEGVPEPAQALHAQQRAAALQADHGPLRAALP